MLSQKLKSKWWRLNHLYKIKSKQGKIVFFHPNAMQQKHRLESFGHRYGYLVKPRQFGFTTDYAIDMLDDACFIPGASAGIIAHDRETLSKIFAIIKRAYENMPEEFKPVAKYDTRNEYKFVRRYDGLPLDNELYVALKIRGTTIPRLHISEAAFIEDRDELKMGAKQSVPKEGRITEETTGNGMNEFYDDVIYAVEKQKSGKTSSQDYKVYFYAWFENSEYSLDGTMPEYDVPRYSNEQELREKYHLTDGQLLWRRWKLDEFRTSTEHTAGLNVFQRFKQEYPATLLEAFQSGMGNIFDLERLMALEPGVYLTAQDAMATEGLLPETKTKVINLITKEVRVWQMPIIGRRYVIGVDPSDGEGSDNTCIDVWLVPLKPTDKLVQVAQYYGKIRPDIGAQLGKEMAEAYNDAFIGPENNMLSFVLFLSKIYDNYFMEVKIDKKTLKRTTTLGWSTNNATRDPMIDDYIALFEDGYLEINSGVTISEMKTFVKKENGKREHADGKHDDSLIAGMIALQLRKYEPRRSRAYATKPF
jgi:hypothetical protein